ncbi:MAG TPA: phosphoglycerate kinase, partial [Gammaproteobacteria bacterium]|nr:phosphoglycerate kinase [Gammaproteobacteria bacterium]
LPTLNFLMQKKTKVIILSHVGRPKGKIVKELSLKPIGEDLKKKLNTTVKLITESIYEIKNKDFFEKFDEEILILENIRFYVEEEQNDHKFAEHLASLGDIYVNDAFSCSHRAHASIHQISKYLPSYSGLQLDLEVAALNKITYDITKPITCIIGGSKISTKIDIIKNLIPKFDNIIIVGGMANNFIEYFGNNIGKSIKEKNCNEIVEQIISLSKKKDCKIIYPDDVLVSKDLNGSSKNKELNQILPDEMILDIGPVTARAWAESLIDAQTIMWNGPVGVFEFPQFGQGTKIIGEAITASSAFSIAGGGDTLAAVEQYDLANGVSYISTGGGAFLELVEGKVLPAVAVLGARCAVT